jgi:hypothetical protein
MSGDKRSETLLPPSIRSDVRVTEESVDDEDMTRLLGFRPSFIPTPASSRRPQPWGMAPVTPHADTATSPSSRPPDSLRPVAMATAAGLSALDTGPHETPPTAITMRTYAVQSRPTATWAAALVVLGVFVGIGSAVYGRGGAADAAAAAATWLDPGRAAAAAQPPRALVDSFTSPPPPASPPPVVAASPAPGPVVEHPVAERPAAEHSGEPAAEALAALAQAPAHGEHGESVKAAPSRPTFVAPGSHWSHHSVARPAAPPPSREPEPVVAAAAAAQDATPAATPAPPPPPAAKATSRRSKKGSDDDMQAASASDALARAQLEAALR